MHKHRQTKPQMTEVFLAAVVAVAHHLDSPLTSSPSADFQYIFTIVHCDSHLEPVDVFKSSLIFVMVSGLE